MNCRTCAGPCCLNGSNIEGDCEGYKPMTHYEQIKAMSIEEMANYMATTGRIYNGCPTLSINCQASCNKCWLDWLRLEVTE